MFKNFTALFLFLLFLKSASAYDLSRKIGVGIVGNYAIPVFGHELNSVGGPDFVHFLE
jgi:hypothetical protein